MHSFYNKFATISNQRREQQRRQKSLINANDSYGGTVRVQLASDTLTQ